jgi:hypothetical protein
MLGTYTSELSSRMIATKTVVLKGDAKQGLVGKAEELRADIMIMGSRGMGAIKKYVTQQYILKLLSSYIHSFSSLWSSYIYIFILHILYRFIFIVFFSMSLIHRIGRSWVQFLITVSTMLPVPS